MGIDIGGWLCGASPEPSSLAGIALAGTSRADAGACILAAASLRRDSESIRNCAETTTSSPASMPESTATSSSVATPSLTTRGANCPGPVTTNTRSRVPDRTTASRGTTTVSSCATVRIVTSANISGLSRSPGLSNTSRTFTVRVRASAYG